MLSFLNNKFVLVLMVLVGVLQLFSVSYLSYVFNQQYILMQYQVIYDNKEEIGNEPGVYDITGTDFEVGIDYDSELENGIVLNDSEFKVFLNGVSNTYSYEEFDIENGEDIYNNVLVYKYSAYMTPYVVGFFIIGALTSYLVIFLLLYMIIKIYEHQQYKHGYATSTFFINRKLKINICIVSAFAAILFYSFASLLIPSTAFVVCLGAAAGLVVQVLQLQNLNKRRNL